MELERVAAVLRPREGFEAADLGLSMLRRWAVAVWSAWLVAVVPVCVVVLGVCGERFWLAMAILWLLKPLFERVPVYVLSRALFGDAPATGETLAQLPRLWGRGLLLGVALHRFDPARCMIQPVALLERSSGEKRSRRERDLGRGRRGTAALVGLLGLGLEVTLTLQLCLAAWFFTPAEFTPDLGPLWGDSSGPLELGWFAWVVRAAWLASYSLAGPITAACGFSLYLHRRMHLEGWDVKIVFQRLAARARSLAPRALGVVLAALAVLALAGPRAAAQDAPATASEVSSSAGAAQDPVDVAREVLQGDDFATSRQTTRWSWSFDPAQPQMGPPEWLAFLFVVAGWTALALLLVAIVVLILRAAGWMVWSKPRPVAAPAELPTHILGLDLRPQSLPADVAAEALALWRSGDGAGALGLLYRAAISRLVEQDGLELQRGDTEGDCLRRVRALDDRGRVEYFGAITRAWLVCAYSRERLADAVVEGLCGEWAGHFERRAA